jgi:hypothetical protein
MSSWKQPGSPGAEPAAEPALARVEIIAGKLAARIYRHEVESQHGAIPCWSYVSEGLTGQQQTEVVFTLRRDPARPAGEAPSEPLQLLATIYQVTETGQRATSGSFTEFGGDGFFGHHVLYVQALAMTGVRLPASCLAALLVTADELRAVREFGTTRVLARLGQASSHYPFPPWADPQRRGLSLERTLESSVLSKVPRASAHDVHVSLTDRQITMAALRSEQLSWQDRLAQVPPEVPLALLTAFDPAANGCLVWVPGQKQPEAIIPPGSNGSRVCGCFLAVIPDQPGNGGKVLEDGFAVELTTEAWQALRRALIDGVDLAIPASGDGMSLALTWRDEVYVSPIDARAYRAEGGWAMHRPEGTGEAAPASRVAIRHVRLLASEEEVAARTTVAAVVAFCEAIRSCAEQVFGGRDDEAGLLVRLQCTPEGHGIKLAGSGEIPPEPMQAFFDALRRLDRLPVRDGEVSFEIELAVAAAGGGGARG